MKKEKLDWELRKSLIWNHIVIGVMEKDKDILKKAVNSCRGICK